MDSNLTQKVVFDERYTLVDLSYTDAQLMIRDRLPEYRDLKISLSEETGDLVIGFYTEDSDQRHFNRTLKLFKKEFKDSIFTPPNTSLENVFFQLMMEKKYHVSTAESCTGGLLAARIINVAGSSSIIDEAFITYSEDAKMRILGIPKKTLETHGAVSLECAGEMARCLKKLTDCQLAISITGLAGPAGGTPELPVGTVFFGIALLNEARTFKKWFSGDRNAVRNKAVSFALSESIRWIRCDSKTEKVVTR
jgi:nicotinamide-nucleotide amidase